MKTWSFYSVDTGEFINSRYSGPEKYLQENTPQGCASVEGVYRFHESKFDLANKAIVEWQPPPPPDTEDQTWSWSAGAKVWEATPTLASVQKSRWAEINAAWDAANLAGFVFDGKIIANDPRTQMNMAAIIGTVGATGALPDDWVGGWKADDNSIVPIPDLATWKSFYAAMVTQGITNYVHAQQLRATIFDPAATATSVEAVQWGSALIGDPTQASMPTPSE